MNFQIINLKKMSSYCFNKRIVNKYDAIILCIDTLMFVNIAFHIDNNSNMKSMVKYSNKSKRNRLYYFIDNKEFSNYDGQDLMYSIYCPFTIDSEKKQIYYNGEIVEETLLALLKNFYRDFSINESNIISTTEKFESILENYYDSYTREISPETKDIFFSVITEFHKADLGYIRFDIDIPKNGKVEEHHPIYHLDIFYSEKVQLKIGKLEQTGLLFDEFINFIEPMSHCAKIEFQKEK